MADFRLTQTGQQVQSILNQASLDNGVLTLHVNNTDIHVTTENKAAWNAKYDKPSGGIPDTDLTAAIQQALLKAMSAYQKPSDGIPSTDLTAAAQALLEAAGTAYQKPSGGIPKTDLATAVQNLLDAAGTAYQKPGTGIPLADLSASVQAAINAAAGQQEAINNLQNTLTGHVGNSTIHVTSQDKTNWNGKATPAEVASAIAAALADYDDSDEVAAAIAAALTSYYTKGQSYSKTEVDNLLSPKQTAAQVTNIVNTALASYSTTSEVAAAIASALTDYYTKSVIDTALAGKQATLSFDQTPTLNSPNPVTSEGIRAAIAAAVNGLVNSSYVQNAISTALADYSTTSQVGTLVSTAITTALASYSTTSEVASAIASALASYYTKSEIDTQMSGKQNTLTFDNAPTENSDNPVKSGGVKAADDNLQNQITLLQNIVADLETIAEGYVRVAGAENPALNYRSYKYHEQGGFGRESVFHLFYPCLVGTKLSGNDAQVGKILHVLKKFGAVTVNNTPMWEDLDGNHHAIDGSEGDVLICNIEPYYQIYGQHDIQGTTYDVFLMARTPFTWQGIDAEPVAKFGISPDYVVSHQDTDDVVRMHSVYNPSWNGNYDAPVGVVGKYIYTTDPDTGDIVETYDSSETLLGGAGGLHSTDIDLPTGEQRAMNNNPDTTKTVPWMNQTAHVCELMQCLLLAEGGTFDAHKASLMGSGFSTNDGATDAADWEAAGSGAKNGMRYVDKNGNLQYRNFGWMEGNTAWAFMLNIASVVNMINSWRSPWHVMEALRAVSHAIQNDVHELEWFTFEGNKYKYRSVDGFNGPAQGEMTCVVWKMMSTKFTSAAKDPSDGTTSLEGKRADFLVSTALLHGVTTQVSPSWWVSGLVFTEDAGQNYEAYMERDQEQLAITPTGDKTTDDAWPFESNYQHAGSFTVGEGYRKNYSNQALMIPNNNANKTGGGLHTYVGAYNWFTGGAAPSGKKSVRGWQRGVAAYYAGLSPLSMLAYISPSDAYSFIGCGTCCRITE